MISYLTKNRPWWLAMFVGVFGCGGCCSGCGCSGRDHPVFHAAKKGEVDKVREFLDADPSLLKETYRRPRRGREWFAHDTGEQLVHIAAASGQIEVLKLLQERGADLQVQVNDFMGSGPQAIHLAAESNGADCVAWLIDHGVPVDARSGMGGGTALHHAARRRSIETMALLLARGAAVDAREPVRGDTPLIGVCTETANDQKDIVAAKMLLDKGADVNAAQEKIDGLTPLHFAAQDGRNIELVTFLLAQKADVQAKDRKGRTPLDVTPVDRPAVAELLIAAGAPRDVWEKRRRDARMPVDPPPPPRK